jgi:hypothetical protein
MLLNQMKNFILQIVFLCVTVKVAVAEPSIKVKTESESRFVYEPFTLRVEVVAQQKPKNLRLQDGSDYKVISLSDGTVLSYTSENTTTFFIEIVASVSGVVTIAPVEVQVGDRILQSSPLRLSVGQPHRSENSKIDIVFSCTNLYVDQAVEMKVCWSSRTPFVQYQELIFEIPLLRSAALAVYPVEPDVPEEQRICLPVNGQRIIAQRSGDGQKERLCFKYILVPLRAGELVSDALHVTAALMLDKQNSNQYPSYFNNNFFAAAQPNSRFVRVYFDAPISALSVSALPEQGRTSLFCGIAGSMKMQTRLSPEKVKVGNPVMLEIELSEMLFGGQLKALPTALFDNIGVDFKVTREPIQSSESLSGRRFVYALRPLRTAINCFPGLALQIFDTQSRQYRMLRTEPLELEVNAHNGRRIFVPAQTEPEKKMERLKGIQGNIKERNMLMSLYNVLEFIGTYAWFFWLGVPLIWLASRRWLDKTERCRTDPAYARAVQAWRTFRRKVGSDEELALRGYLADRFDWRAEAVTAESCATELRRMGLKAERVAEVRKYLQQAEARKYSPYHQDAGNMCGQARRIVHALERALPLTLIALLLFSGRLYALEPDALFRQALELQNVKPDQAQPLFIEAALGYEARRSHFNAANSWYFAGETGHALAAYLAAERRAPFRREIRESINFIRMQRNNKLNTEKHGVADILKLSERLCRFDIRLLLGVLTCFYLGAWGFYFGKRIRGSLPPPSFCRAYGVVTATLLILVLYCVFQPRRGVIIRSTQARLGPGYAYDKAYENALAEATEFQWRGIDSDWVQAHLADDNTVWLHRSTCVRVVH